VCPKLDGLADRRPLDPADDFDGLFADLDRWYRQGRAVGFPAGLDPLMRDVAAAFDEHHRGLDRRAARAAVRSELIDVLVAAKLARRAES
jgi:hypothetical protein